jgi:acetamidase/formamidase
LLKDLEETVAEIKQEEADPQTRELQAELEKLALKFDEETFFKLAAMAGVTGVAPPEKMEKVNMLLEALPYDVSEFMLTEYLNNMMQLNAEDEAS